VARNQLGIDVIAKATAAAKNFDEFKAAIDRAAKSTQKADDKLGSMDSRLKKAEASMERAARGVERFQRLLGAGGLVAIAVGAARSLDRMAESIVRTSNVWSAAKVNVDAAAVAVDHMTTKTELYAQANKLTTAGVKISDAQFAKLAGGIARAADASGKDLVPALNAATDSLVRGSVEGLAMVGIRIDQARAERIYAGELDKSRTELSLAEKQAASMQEIMKELGRENDRVTTRVNEQTAAWVRFKNQVTDALDEQMPKALNAFASGILWMTDDLLTDLERDPLLRLLFRGEEFEQRTTTTRGVAGLGGRFADEAAQRARQRELASRALAEAQAETERIMEAQALKAEEEATKRLRSKGGKRKGINFGRIEALDFSGPLEKFRQQVRENQEKLEADLSEWLHERNEIMLEADLQRIQQREDLGQLDPVQALFMERDAKLEHLEFLQENTDDVLELERIKLERQQVIHDTRMGHIELERKARREALEEEKRAAAQFAELTNTISAASRVQVSAFGLIAETVARSEKAKTAILAAGAMVDAGIHAALEQARAIAAFATLNIPQGLAHQAAAIAFTTAAGQAGRELANAGGSGGGLSRRPVGGSAIGVGGPVAGTSANALPDPSDFPRSVGEQLERSSAASPAGAGSRGAGGAIIHIERFTTLGKVDEDEVLVPLGRALKRAEGSVGRFD